MCIRPEHFQFFCCTSGFASLFSLWMERCMPRLFRTRTTWSGALYMELHLYRNSNGRNTARIVRCGCTGSKRPKDSGKDTWDLCSQPVEVYLCIYDVAFQVLSSGIYYRLFIFRKRVHLDAWENNKWIVNKRIWWYNWKKRNRRELNARGSNIVAQLSRQKSKIFIMNWYGG